MRRIAILGSTGSIGSQALDIIGRYPERFAVAGLAANTNVAALAVQAERFRPGVLSIGTAALVEELCGRLSYAPRAIGWGAEGLAMVALTSDAQRVLAASDGIAALDAVMLALAGGIDVALSNKELLVAAGEPLLAAARASGAHVLPVDSEHSAVFQCLLGERVQDVASVVLTASGGPFRELSLLDMRDVTPAQALAHPTWAMGQKNTIDSATMMNKGLEVIEASRLFGLAPEQIEVVVHRQSVAHAFVRFKDGNVKAQLAAPDMRVPIGYALAYPERLPDADAGKTRAALGLGSAPAELTFEPLDNSRFPAVQLCYRALRAGGTCPAVLSAANEEAGRAFLQGKVKFTEICALVERALDAHSAEPPTLEAIRRADVWARATTLEAIGQGAHGRMNSTAPTV
jgi:1-deoxy-D-xylulose-5-phosphate reductoisomerase